MQHPRLLARLILAAPLVLAACSTRSAAQSTVDTSEPGVITVKKAGPTDGRWSGATVTYTARMQGEGYSGGAVAVVVRVEENSPAGMAGLLAADTVIAVNGTAVAGQPRLLSAPPGTALTYRVRRNGVERDVSFVVGRRPTVAVPRDSGAASRPATQVSPPGAPL